MGGRCGAPERNGAIRVRRSFSYTDSYNADIRFDNIYISTYFCQIEERRKKLVSGPRPALRAPQRRGFALQEGGGEGEGALEPLILRLLSQGKRTLLPLRKAEKKTVIFPYDPAIQALEMKNLVRPAGEARTWGVGGGQTRQRGLRAHPSPVLWDRYRSSWRRCPFCCCWLCCVGWTGPSTLPSTPSATTPSSSTPSAVSAGPRDIPPSKLPPPRSRPAPILPIVPPPPGVNSQACTLTVATGRGGLRAQPPSCLQQGGVRKCRFSALTSPRPLRADFPDT